MAGRLGIYYLRTHTLSRELFQLFSQEIHLLCASKILSIKCERLAGALTFCVDPANFRWAAQTFDHQRKLSERKLLDIIFFKVPALSFSNAVASSPSEPLDFTVSTCRSVNANCDIVIYNFEFTFRQ
jgi:hypothetical protein